VKIIDILKEGEVIPLFGQDVTFHNDHNDLPDEEDNTNPYPKPFLDQLRDEVPPIRMSQDEIDDLMYEYRNLGVGNNILYKNRLAQIVRTPGIDRYIIQFDDTGERKIIGRKDGAISLIPRDQL